MGEVKIALVHDFIPVFGGAERVLLRLHELFPDAPIYTAFYDPAVVEKHFLKARIITSSLQGSLLRKKYQALFSRMPRAVEEWDFSQFDVVISSSSAYAHGIITGPDTTHICYCHTPMRYAWDWHAENLRDRKLKGVLRVLVQRAMSKVRLWDFISSKRVDVWIANSKTIHERILKYYRVDSKIIHPPVDTEFFELSTRERGNHAFTVSRLTANKKVDQIIEASAKTGTPLRIGGDGPEREHLEQLARSLKADVVFLGKISEEKKREELSGAKYFIFASEDDFGIAPLEAEATGTPVIALGRGGALETVVDGKTGIHYPEQSIDSLTSAIGRANMLTFDPEHVREKAEQYSCDLFDHAIRELVASHAKSKRP